MYVCLYVYVYVAGFLQYRFTRTPRKDSVAYRFLLDMARISDLNCTGMACHVKFENLTGHAKGRNAGHVKVENLTWPAGHTTKDIIVVILDETEHNSLFRWYGQGLRIRQV